MATRRTAVSAAAVGIGILASLALTAAPSWAAGGTKLCVPEAEEREVLTLKHGKCRRGYKATSLGTEGKEGKQGKPGAEGRPGPEGKLGLEGKAGPEGKTGPEGKAGTTGFTSSELETLKGILPCIKAVTVGIGGKPTVQFSGCNVQIVNGEGKTESTNGEGNLVIGYDENSGEQTGSHNLVVGRGLTFTSYGGIVAGIANRISAPFASVSGGDSNFASGEASSVSGGLGNRASGLLSSISGGNGNTASGERSSVSGGRENHATNRNASVSGGEGNTASGEQSSVSGGVNDTAFGAGSSVSGGFTSAAIGEGSSVSGGGENRASSFGAWIGGGAKNEVFSKVVVGEFGVFASVFGGKENKTAKDYEAIP